MRRTIPTRKGICMKRWQRWSAIIAIPVTLAVAGCSVADTAANQVGLHYKNGPFSNRVYMGCVQPSRLEYHKVNDDYFYYPATTAQRTLTFGPGGDFQALTITSKEGQIMSVPANITFHLNASCKAYTDAAGKTWPGGILQKFHETIGMQYAAYATEGGDEPGKGWDQVLDKFLRAPAERGVSNAALGFGWSQLFTDPVTKGNWENASKIEIPKIVKEQTGEDYFIIDSIVLQKPDPNDTLKAELANNQAAQLRANTAETDKSTAANFPGGITGYTAYQMQLAVARAIADGKVQAVPVPAGSPVIVGGGH